MGSKYGFTFDFFGEEFGTDASSEQADYFISVDPIDGTRNFKDKVGYSSISIAFFRNGVCEAGVINEINNQHDYNDERYCLYVVIKGCHEPPL